MPVLRRIKRKGLCRMGYLLAQVKPGVIVGDDVTKVYEHAREHQYALPQLT